MSTIAKGEITLSPVNDAYTVLITPASCTIVADFDGSNHRLDNAKGTISVKRGAVEVPFKITGIARSSEAITVAYFEQQATTIPFEITQVDSTITNGYVDFNIKTDDGFNYTAQVRFFFAVVRDSTMLDWIQDWDGTKSKIGGTYIMTPKLFVGKKEDVIAEVDGVPTWKTGALTGVYIGPDLLSSDTPSVGIYGYLKDAEIFHINADGGFIGGWTFNEGGLQSVNGVVNILSEGSIFAHNPETTGAYWGIYANGNASFANGNVKFFADGSAEFAGKITSTAGYIAGWEISQNQLRSDRLILDSKNRFIGINAAAFQVDDFITGDVAFPVLPEGGIKLWYTSADDFGMAAWGSGEKVFQLGSINMIAGWNFNHQAIWSGAVVPSLTQGTYADSADSLTIAPNGIRSNSWYVDADGTASFVGGLVQFNTEDAEMFGWLMRRDRLSTKYASLVSDEDWAGLFVSVANIREVSAHDLETIVKFNGGICIYSDGGVSYMEAYDTKGNLGFQLSSNGNNSISSWFFDETAIYIGSRNLSPKGFTLTPGSMALMASGIHGYQWKLLSDGSGAIARGNISWDEYGNVSFASSVRLSWQNISGAMGNRFTHIDSNGLYTGSIKNTTETWALNDNGSGSLASGNISWDESGELTICGNITATTGKIGEWVIDSQKRLASKDGQITLDAESRQITLTTNEVLSSSASQIIGFGGYGSKITLSVSDGVVKTSLARTSYTDDYSNQTYTAPSTGISYISPQGIFANLAGIEAIAASTGIKHRAAIAGLGSGELNKMTWEQGKEMSAVIGVYGRASNTGTAPAYGGYFYNLKACGLILNRIFIADNSATTTQLSSSDVFVFGVCNKGVTKTIYLPNDGIEGRIVMVKQMGAGTIRVDTSGGQTLYDDTSENDYCDIPEGYLGIFVLGIWNKSNVTTHVWSINRIKL